MNWKNLSNGDKTIIIISCAVCLAISIGMGILIYNYFDGYTSKPDELAEDQATEEAIPPEVVEETVVEKSSESTDDYGRSSLPDWIPDYYRNDFVEENYYVDTKPNDYFLSWSGKFSGKINTYSIVMHLVVQPNGVITGKYAYESTLRKYGDVDSSWFRLDGVILCSESGDIDIPVFFLRSYEPQKGMLFEFFSLYMAEDAPELSGSMMNVKYLTNPTPKLYDVYLTK